MRNLSLSFHLVAVLAGGLCLCAPVMALAQQTLGVAAVLPAQAPAIALAPPRPRLVEQAARIEQLIANGAHDEAIATARAFMQAVGAQTGFGVTNVQLVQMEAPNYGVYSPRVTNVFQIGEPIYTYVELYGFSVEPVPDMANRMVFDVAFTVHDADGTQLTDTLISMGDVVLNTYSNPLDGYLNLTYRITGAQGPATLRTQITDRASGQMAEFIVPVVFEAAATADEPGK